MAGKIYLSHPTDSATSSNVRSTIWTHLAYCTSKDAVDQCRSWPIRAATSTTSTYMGQYTDQWGETSLLCRWWTISMKSPVFLSTAGVLELSQDALASWVLAAHLRPDFSMENLLIEQGTVLGSYFLYRFWDSAFALSPSYTSTPSFVFTGWRAVSIFKFSLQPEVSTCWTLLMAWLWEFPWEDAITTWLFCKLPQADQVETARCRDLRLSKSVNIWELWLQGSLHVAWLVWRSWLRVLIVFGSKKVRPDHHFCTVRRL